MAVPFVNTPDPKVVVPFRRVTLPEGEAPPGPGCNTVAVNVTVVPASTVLAESTSPVKVPALVTVTAVVPFDNP
jgi:hypothetical protein